MESQNSEPAVIGPRVNRALWPVALILVLMASYLAGVTIFSVWTAKSEVPWRDQWTFLEDVQRILSHDWGRLWYSYWGARWVSVRLITLLDLQLFSLLNTPLVVFILLCQSAHVALLVYVARRLLDAVSRPVFLIVTALLLQFGFSSLQLENLIWAGQVGYILGWACATAAFFLLALFCEGPRRREILLAASVVAGVVSTVSTPAGLFVWPALIVQSFILPLPPRVRAALVVLGTFAAAIYLHGYEQGPVMGMGVRNALRHPEQSIPILGMLLAAPFTSVSNRLAEAVGCVALVIVLSTLFKTCRARPLPVLTIPVALTLFALLSFCSIVTSRISPEFIAQREALHLAVVPSRYYTFVFFFWAGVLFISTRLMLSNKRRWPQFAALGSLAFVFTFGLSSWQIGEAANWRGYYRELDVAGSALIMHVDDPSNRYLTQVYPDPELRSRMSLWLESGGKALFAEKRATLPGIRIGPGQIDAGRCRGAIQSAMPLSDGVIRLTGWVLDSQNESPPRDVAFADSSGTIVGIGRSGLRRPDLKGSAGISSLDTIGWQGYARLHTKTPITAFGVLDGSDRYCQAGPSVSLGD